MAAAIVAVPPPCAGVPARRFGYNPRGVCGTCTVRSHATWRLESAPRVQGERRKGEIRVWKGAVSAASDGIGFVEGGATWQHQSGLEEWQGFGEGLSGGVQGGDPAGREGAMEGAHKESFARSLIRGPTTCHLASSPNLSTAPLLYMPYLRQQWATLLTRATGLRDLPLPQSLSWQTSQKGQQGARVENWLLRSDRLRRIRMTYFDSGGAAQAFNSLCYPDYGCNLPLLGIDLLAFGDKILCVIDFQPIDQSPDAVERHTCQLAPIRAQYADLCHVMTTRHFDISQFFSPHHILFRSSKGPSDPVLQAPGGRLFEVFTLYLDHYLDLVEKFEFDWRPESVNRVKAGQIAYDQYTEARDPALKIFTNYFGAEWSHSMTHDFLFSGAKPKS